MHRGGGPDEWFGIGVGLLLEAVDGGREIGDAFEEAAFEPPSCQLGEEALNGVEPGGGGRGEVEMKALVSPEPGAELGMLVCGVIVEDQMHRALGRGFGIDLVEEADELLMPVAAHALADDLAVEHVERGEQGGCPVPLIIMVIGAQRPRFIGSPGWVQSSAWIWLFSSTDSTSACSGGLT